MHPLLAFLFPFFFFFFFFFFFLAVVFLRRRFIVFATPKGGRATKLFRNSWAFKPRVCSHGWTIGAGASDSFLFFLHSLRVCLDCIFFSLSLVAVLGLFVFSFSFFFESWRTYGAAISVSPPSSSVNLQTWQILFLPSGKTLTLYVLAVSCNFRKYTYIVT